MPVSFIVLFLFNSAILFFDMLFLFPRKPVLTPGQIERLSNIFDNAGQVALGAGVVAPLFAGFDKIDIGSVLSGLVLVSLCWILSMWLAKKKDVYL